MSEAEIKLITTAIVGFVTLVGSVLAFFEGRRRYRKAKRKHVNAEDGDVAQQLEAFAANPLGTMRELIRSNKDLQDEMRRVRTDFENLSNKFDEREREHRSFKEAAARWVYDIMMFLMGHHLEMPYPTGADAETLREVIPMALQATRPRPAHSNPTKENSAS